MSMITCTACQERFDSNAQYDAHRAANTDMRRYEGHTRYCLAPWDWWVEVVLPEIAHALERHTRKERVTR